MGTIYIALNTINGKSYIGKTTTSFGRRLTHHKYQAKKHKTNSVFHAAIRKYGIDAFSFTNKDIPDEDLNETEIMLIKDYKYAGMPLYNLTAGGEGSTGCTPWNKGKTGIYSGETLKQMSESQKERLKEKEVWNKGKNAPQIAKAKMKPIVLIHPSGKEEQFCSAKAAAEKYNLQRQNLSHILRGKRSHHKQYKARYLDE